MNFTCNREALLAALQAVESVRGRAGIKPVLLGFRCEAIADRVTVGATDLERYACRSLDATGTEPGVALLPDRLLAALKVADCEFVELEATAAGVRLDCGETGRYDFQSEDPAEFPPAPESPAEEATGVRLVPAGELLILIARTAYCTAGGESSRNYSLTGVLWEFDGPLLRLAGTDSKRLAVAEAVVTNGGEATRALVPGRACQSLARLLANEDTAAPVLVALRPNEAVFATQDGWGLFYTRLVEGRFPPWKEIVPKAKPVGVARVAADRLLAAVRQAAVTVDIEARSVTLAFKPGRLTLSAESAAAGKSRATLALEYAGEPLSIALTSTDLTECLHGLGAELVELSVWAPEKPVLLRAGERFRFMAMPLCKW